MAAAPVNQFDVARKRAATQENANQQAAQDAIKRRMASMGGGPSGAMVKLEGQARDESAKRLATANEGIDVAEAAENRRVGEIKEARDFQKSERLGSQEFAALQAEAQRKYQTGERLSSQEFAALEAGKNRDFATSERLGSQEFAAGESKLGRDLQADQFGKTMDFNKQRAYMDDAFKSASINMAKEQFEKNFNLSIDQFRHQQRIDQKNLDLAARIQRANENQPGFLGSLFSDFGIRGKGTWGGGPKPWD